MKLEPGMLNLIILDRKDIELIRLMGSGSNVAQTADKMGITGMSVCRRRDEIKRRVRSAIARARKRKL